MTKEKRSKIVTKELSERKLCYTVFVWEEGEAAGGWAGAGGGRGGRPEAEWIGANDDDEGATEEEATTWWWWAWASSRFRKSDEMNQTKIFFHIAKHM